MIDCGPVVPVKDRSYCTESIKVIDFIFKKFSLTLSARNTHQFHPQNVTKCDFSLSVIYKFDFFILNNSYNQWFRLTCFIVGGGVLTDFLSVITLNH